MMSSRKDDIAAHFGAAHHYEHAASIQQRSAHLLFEHIKRAYEAHPPRHILEFGCGTGLLTRTLIKAFPHAQFHITDLSSAMLARTEQALLSDPLIAQHGRLPPRISLYVMDGEAPQPHMSNGFDLITSNLCLQWFEDRAHAFKALTSYLAPHGRLMVTTLLAGSLQQWRESCTAAHTTCGVPDYPTLADLQQDWPACGHGTWHEQLLHDPTASAYRFLKGLRMIGASLPRGGHTPSTINGLKRAMAYYDRHYDHVSYHIGFGSFQKGD